MKFVDPLTFLTSARNSLTTIYDVSRSNSGTEMIHCWSYPYALSTSKSSFNPSNRRVGTQSVRKQGESNTVCLFELSERGALYMSELSSGEVLDGEGLVWNASLCTASGAGTVGHGRKREVALAELGVKRQKGVYMRVCSLPYRK